MLGVGLVGGSQNLLLGLDTHRAPSDRDPLPHPLSARIVEPEMAQAALVQQPKHGKARRRA